MHLNLVDLFVANYVVSWTIGYAEVILGYFVDYFMFLEIFFFF